MNKALLVTFEAYVNAKEIADRAFADYKLLRASEAEVHRTQLAESRARAAHLAAIAESS